MPGKLQKRILVFLHHGGVLVLELVEHAGQHKSRLGPKLAAQALRQRSRGCARLSDARDVGVLRHHPLDGARDVAVVPRREPGMICELAQLRQRAQSLLPLGARDGAPKFGLLLVRRSLLQRIQNIRGIGEFVRVRKRTRRRGIAAGVRAALAAVDVHRLRLRAVPVLSKSASRARRSGGRGGRHLGHLRLHPRAHLLQQIAAHRVGAEPAGELDGQRLGGVANLGVLALEEMRDALEDGLRGDDGGRAERFDRARQRLRARQHHLRNLVIGSFSRASTTASEASSSHSIMHVSDARSTVLGRPLIPFATTLAITPDA